MFTVRPRQARLSFRIALTGMLLLLSLVGPAPSRSYAAAVLSGDLDGGGGPDTFADLPSEPAGPEDIAPSLGSGTAHVPTIEMGIADTGLASTLDVLQDPITPTLQFSSSTYSVDEDAGPALITVTLVPTSTDPVTVTYAIVPGTATPGSDYTGTGGTLSFAPDDETETISVSI
ncbi:MAG: Calx-beta domain-containing protein, partial [Anaerolineae bacterium]